MAKKKSSPKRKEKDDLTVVFHKNNMVSRNDRKGSPSYFSDSETSMTNDGSRSKGETFDGDTSDSDVVYVCGEVSKGGDDKNGGKVDNFQIKKEGRINVGEALRRRYGNSDDNDQSYNKNSDNNLKQSKDESLSENDISISDNLSFNDFDKSSDSEDESSYESEYLLSNESEIDDAETCSCKLKNFGLITDVRPDIEYFSFNANLQNSLEMSVTSLGKLLLQQKLLQINDKKSELKQHLLNGDILEYESSSEETYEHTCDQEIASDTLIGNVMVKHAPIVKLHRLPNVNKSSVNIKQDSIINEWLRNQGELDEMEKPSKPVHKRYFTKKSTGGKGYVKHVKEKQKKKKPAPTRKKSVTFKLDEIVIQSSSEEETEEKTVPVKPTTRSADKKPEGNEVQETDESTLVEGQIIEGLMLCLFNGDIVPLRRSKRVANDRQAHKDDKTKANLVLDNAKEVKPLNDPNKEAKATTAHDNDDTDREAKATTALENDKPKEEAMVLDNDESNVDTKATAALDDNDSSANGIPASEHSMQQSESMQDVLCNEETRVQPAEPPVETMQEQPAEPTTNQEKGATMISATKKELAEASKKKQKGSSAEPSAVTINNKKPLHQVNIEEMADATVEEDTNLQDEVAKSPAEPGIASTIEDGEIVQTNDELVSNKVKGNAKEQEKEKTEIVKQDITEKPKKKKTKSKDIKKAKEVEPAPSKKKSETDPNLNDTLKDTIDSIEDLIVEDNREISNVKTSVETSKEESDNLVKRNKDQSLDTEEEKENFCTNSEEEVPIKRNLRRSSRIKSIVKEEAVPEESSMTEEVTNDPKEEAPKGKEPLNEEGKEITNELSVCVTPESSRPQSPQDMDISPVPNVCRDPRLRARQMSRDEELKLLKAQKLEELRKNSLHLKEDDSNDTVPTETNDVDKKEETETAKTAQLIDGKRDYKKKRKNVDTELLYKTPLSDLHSETESRYTYNATPKKIHSNTTAKYSSKTTKEPKEIINTAPMSDKEKIALDLKLQLLQEKEQLKCELIEMKKQRQHKESMHFVPKSYQKEFIPPNARVVETTNYYSPSDSYSRSELNPSKSETAFGRPFEQKPEGHLPKILLQNYQSPMRDYAGNNSFQLPELPNYSFNGGFQDSFVSPPPVQTFNGDFNPVEDITFPASQFQGNPVLYQNQQVNGECGPIMQGHALLQNRQTDVTSVEHFIPPVDEAPCPSSPDPIDKGSIELNHSAVVPNIPASKEPNSFTPNPMSEPIKPSDNCREKRYHYEDREHQYNKRHFNSTRSDDFYRRSDFHRREVFHRRENDFHRRDNYRGRDFYNKDRDHFKRKSSRDHGRSSSPYQHNHRGEPNWSQGRWDSSCDWNSRRKSTEHHFTKYGSKSRSRSRSPWDDNERSLCGYRKKSGSPLPFHRRRSPSKSGSLV